MSDLRVDRHTPRSRRTARLLLGLAALALVAILVGIAMLLRTLRPTIIADETLAGQTLVRIAPALVVPGDLEPREVVRLSVLFLMPLEGVVLTGSQTGPDGQPLDVLYVVQMQGPAADNPATQAESIRTAESLGPMQADGFDLTGRPELLTVTVGDQPRTAILSTLRDSSGREFRHAQATIPSDGGPLSLVLRRPVDRFAVEEVRQMLESGGLSP